MASELGERENPTPRENKDYLITHGFDPTMRSVKIWDFLADDGDFSEDNDEDSIRKKKGVIAVMRDFMTGCQ